MEHYRYYYPLFLKDRPPQNENIISGETDGKQSQKKIAKLTLELNKLKKDETSINKFKFTKRKIESLPLPDKTITYHDTENTGLKLTISKAGTYTFMVYRKIKGRPERNKVPRGKPSRYRSTFSCLESGVLIRLFFTLLRPKGRGIKPQEIKLGIAIGDGKTFANHEMHQPPLALYQGNIAQEEKRFRKMLINGVSPLL